MPEISDDDYQNRLVRYDCEQSIERARLAYAYLMGTIDRDDAADIIYHCQPVVGWYPIETFSEDSVLDSLVDQYGDHPEFEPLVSAACRRVWHKWNSSGDTAGAAEDWARDLVLRYTKEDGLTLVDQYELPAVEEG